MVAAEHPSQVITNISTDTDVLGRLRVLRQQYVAGAERESRDLIRRCGGIHERHVSVDVLVVVDVRVIAQPDVKLSIDRLLVNIAEPQVGDTLQGLGDHAVTSPRSR